VFVVGHLGEWRPTAKVLFESESLSGNIKKSRKSWEEVAGTITARFGASRNNFEELAPALTCGFGKSSGQDLQPGLIIPFYASEKSATLTASGAGFSRPGQTSTAHENYVAHAFKVGGGCEGGGKGYLGSDEKAFTISTTQDQQIAIGSSDKAGTLRANPGSGWRSNGTPVEGVAIQNMAVRRLTEIECERLQGFPDNYTNIKENCPSGPRYKALGNSMAVPVMRWIGNRIQMVEDGLI
jgi:DNA (cytosine-5)-methyltransferase 1